MGRLVLPDVNVLVYAFRPEEPRRAEYLSWLRGMAGGDQAYGMSDLVLSGFLRIVTNPRAFSDPDRLEDAMAFVSSLRSQPHCVPIGPGPRHWEIFTGLCTRSQAKGNLVADAFLAALAIEHGCEWITTDRDYARFPGLRWRHPLEP